MAKHLNDQETSTARKKLLGKKLYAEILRKDWTQTELAERSGIAKGVISSYMVGRSYPTPANLLKMARALQVDPVDLSVDDRFAEFSANGAVETEDAPYKLLPIAGRPDLALLEIRQVVPKKVAVEILSLLFNAGSPPPKAKLAFQDRSMVLRCETLEYEDNTDENGDADDFAHPN